MWGGAFIYFTWLTPGRLFGRGIYSNKYGNYIRISVYGMVILLFNDQIDEI